MMYRCFILLTAVLLGCPLVMAQEEGAADGAVGPNIFGIHGGPFLPSRIPRVREVLFPVWGVRYSRFFRGDGADFEAAWINDKGVHYRFASISYLLTFKKVNDEDISDIALPYLGAGFDFHYFKGRSRYTPTEYKLVNGWHLGGGFIMDISSRWVFRNDYKLLFSPGRILYINLGVGYRF